MQQFAGQLTAETAKKDLGAVFTPNQIVDFLVSWAVRSKEDVVIDPGAGEGAFITAAVNRLAALGATPDLISNQLHAVEYYEEHFKRLTQTVSGQTGNTFPNLRHADLFDVQLPQADAVIGNPPYVIRHRLNDAQNIRLKVSIRIGQQLRKQQADLYTYFIMYAGSFLKEGGRLALIISDSWLDMNFGTELKTFLLRYFKLHTLISFDKRVFPEALVKTLILLAERTSKPKTDAPVRFIRIKRPVTLPEIEHHLSSDQGHEDGLKMSVAPQGTLDPRHYWGIYFKAPELYFQLSTNSLFTALGQLAETRIGLQTLAKKFYILSKTAMEEQCLEPEFFEPVAVSPRDISTPVLDERTHLENVVLLCPKEKEELAGTNVLGYIKAAEQRAVEIRTRHKDAQGYNNLPRLKRAGRSPWYNLRSETNRRGRYPILLPRRVYKKYMTVWNKGGVIANEDFLEARPRNPQHLLPLLALLNSSFAELMIRSVGHIYGGGVCNLNPNDLKILPILDVRKLDAAACAALAEAYHAFVASDGSDPTIIDNVVFNILGNAPSAEIFYGALDELRGLSTTLKTL